VGGTPENNRKSAKSAKKEEECARAMVFCWRREKILRLFVPFSTFIFYFIFGPKLAGPPLFP
jgi:hypothetical protein